MVNFINPQPKSSSSIIVAPYPGEVNEVDPSVCDGNIKIKHNINGVSYISEFCNVERISVRVGESVRQKEKIGNLGYKSLKSWVYDNHGKKYSMAHFINDAEKDKESKVTTTKKEKKQPINYDTKYSGLAKLPIDVLLSPLSLMKDVMSYKTDKQKQKEKEKEEQNLNEEINRIKELLK